VTHRIRLPRLVPVVAIMGLVLTLALSPSASADRGGVPNGGNSANARLCQNGGWQNVQTSDGVPFSSQGECVAAGAQGLGIVPLGPSPAFAFSFGYSLSNLCTPIVTMTGFASNTTFTFTMDYRVIGTEEAHTVFLSQLTTNADGETQFTNPMDFPEGGFELQAHMGGFDSEWVVYDC